MIAKNIRNFISFFILIILLQSVHLSSADPIYEDIKNLVETKKIKKIDDLLAELPSDYREGFTLLYQSRSLQSASFQFPRTILFGNDGTLLMAFNGHPDQTNYNELELIQWRAQEARFEFRKITFPENSVGEVSFSEANPKQCMGCHRGGSGPVFDPVPNWDPYPHWEGAYAGIDDSYVRYSFSDRELDRIHDLTGISKEKGSSELITFLKDYQSKERYRNITNLDKHYLRALNVESSGFYNSTLNRGMTKTLFHHNSIRVARKLMEVKNYDKWKFALAGLGFNCAIEKLIPTNLINQFKISRETIVNQLFTDKIAYHNFTDLQYVLAT